MLKRYLVLSVATAAFSLPSLVNAAQQNILMCTFFLNQQTGKPAADLDSHLSKRKAIIWLVGNYQCQTDNDGRIKACGPINAVVTTGDYRCRI